MTIVAGPTIEMIRRGELQHFVLMDETGRGDHRSTERKNPVRSDAETMLDAIRKDLISRAVERRKSKP